MNPIAITRSARALRLAVVVAGMAAALGAVGASADTSGTLTNPKHFFWAPGQDISAQTTANSLTNDLIWHGGNAGPGAIGVEQKPAVYLIWWGPEWAQGFQTADVDGKLYSSKSLQSYLQSFFANVGGSPWAGVQTQYCNNTLVGSTSCVGGSGFVTNPTHQLKGVWTDPTPVPSDIVTIGLAQNLVDDPIADEAMRAAAHFHYDAQATYIVLTPPGTIGTGEPYYCGYHTQTTALDGLGNPYRLQYAFIPWLNANWPGLGPEDCGMHNVNATSDAFGNGIWDGYTIVTGHEYAEAVTDPDNFVSVQDGWNDDQTSENGDKCAWYHTQNIAVGGHQFAVQPLWSNEAFDAGKDGCQVSR
jgi:serine protease